MKTNHEEQPLDESLVTLIVVGTLILTDDIMATEAGRERLKSMFRDALLAFGDFETLRSFPEFGVAMSLVRSAKEGTPEAA